MPTAFRTIKLKRISKRIYFMNKMEGLMTFSPNAFPLQNILLFLVSVLLGRKPDLPRPCWAGIVCAAELDSFPSVTG